MVQSSDLSASVGQQVRQRREQRGLTAAELARRARLSKATLSGIEAGRGNPTIDTLDAIAQALAIPLADILAIPEHTETVHLVGAPAGDQPISQQLLHRLSGGHQVETWRLRMQAGATFEGVPHASGTREQLLVTRGSLAAGHQDDLRQLGPGDSLAFDGAVPHRYTAGPDGADVLVILASPASS